jgi:predicted TIM-barrel fold metal-dependent hydrolase
MVEPLARRVASLGWHLQLHWTAKQIVENESLLRRLPTPLVFDQMARLPVDNGVHHPAFGVVLKLMHQRRAWVKLSGPYLESRTGPEDDFSRRRSDCHDVGCARPDRLVWGSDWPQNDWHGKRPSEAEHKLLAALRRWAGTEEMVRKLLVVNPAALLWVRRSIEYPGAAS